MVRLLQKLRGFPEAVAFRNGFTCGRQPSYDKMGNQCAQQLPCAPDEFRRDRAAAVFRNDRKAFVERAGRGERFYDFLL